MQLRFKLFEVHEFKCKMSSIAKNTDVTFKLRPAYGTPCSFQYFSFQYFLLTSSNCVPKVKLLTIYII